MTRFILFCLILSACLAPAFAASLPDLAHTICPEFGVSPDIALRVMRVESACKPHALGVQVKGDHQGYFPSDHIVATVMLKNALAVTPNVGIGAMQINWRAWGKSLGVSPESLLDPETNIMVGCALLGRHLQSNGPLAERIGRYHSNTPKRRLPYGEKIIKATPCNDSW